MIDNDNIQQKKMIEDIYYNFQMHKNENIQYLLCDVFLSADKVYMGLFKVYIIFAFLERLMKKIPYEDLLYMYVKTFQQQDYKKYFVDFLFPMLNQKLLQIKQQPIHANGVLDYYLLNGSFIYSYNQHENTPLRFQYTLSNDRSIVFPHLNQVKSDILEQNEEMNDFFLGKSEKYIHEQMNKDDLDDPKELLKTQWPDEANIQWHLYDKDCHYEHIENWKYIKNENPLQGLKVKFKFCSAKQERFQNIKDFIDELETPVKDDKFKAIFGSFDDQPDYSREELQEQQQSQEEIIKQEVISEVQKEIQQLFKRDSPTQTKKLLEEYMQKNPANLKELYQLLLKYNEINQISTTKMLSYIFHKPASLQEVNYDKITCIVKKDDRQIQVFFDQYLVEGKFFGFELHQEAFQLLFEYQLENFSKRQFKRLIAHISCQSYISEYNIELICKIMIKERLGDTFYQFISLNCQNKINFEEKSILMLVENLKEFDSKDVIFDFLSDYIIRTEKIHLMSFDILQNYMIKLIRLKKRVQFMQLLEKIKIFFVKTNYQVKIDLNSQQNQENENKYEAIKGKNRQEIFSKFLEYTVQYELYNYAQVIYEEMLKVKVPCTIIDYQHAIHAYKHEAFESQENVLEYIAKDNLEINQYCIVQLILGSNMNIEKEDFETDTLFKTETTRREKLIQDIITDNIYSNKIIPEHELQSTVIDYFFKLSHENMMVFLNHVILNNIEFEDSLLKQIKQIQLRTFEMNTKSAVKEAIYSLRQNKISQDQKKMNAMLLKQQIEQKKRKEEEEVSLKQQKKEMHIQAQKVKKEEEERLKQQQQDADKEINYEEYRKRFLDEQTKNLNQIKEPKFQASRQITNSKKYKKCIRNPYLTEDEKRAKFEKQNIIGQLFTE